MEYGYFDNEKHEYVITNPHTPVKWINYVGSLDFGGLVDHTGGLLICCKDPAFNRITKYIPQLPSSDFKGHTIYIRQKTAAGYELFSPLYVPVLKPFQFYNCRVGLGYTIITSVYGPVKTEIIIFTPDFSNCVAIDIKVTNTGSAALELDVIPVIEYSHPIAIRQFANADWVPQTMQSKLIVQEDGFKTILQYPFMNKDLCINWFTSNHPISSFATDRKKFLGRNEYGTWAHPLSLDEPELDSYEALRGDNIAALMHHLGEVAPGECKRIICLLGQSDDPDQANKLIKQFRRPAEIDRALVDLQQYWTAYLVKMQVETPDASMNAMLNVHNPYQCFTTYNWSRFLSLYQLGLGSRGIGFRDSSQDVLGIMDRIPEKGKQLIKKLLQVQNTDGSAMHLFYPLTMEGTCGEAEDNPASPDYYGDDHLWIILAITAYLKETGDLAFLDEQVSYYHYKMDGEPVLGTVFDHMQRALTFTRTNVGQHGLPLLGYADWNDAVNLSTGAESMFIANLYGKALLEMIELCEFRQDIANEKVYRAHYAEMAKNFEAHAWDGEWYRRYFDARGEPLGSRNNEAGQIYTNGQSWPVISGFAGKEKSRIALDSVAKHLNTSKGIKLSTPGYNKYNKDKGGVTTYPPGAKENGGIFLHSNPWVIIAETLLGNGQQAFQYYSQINPAAKNDIIDEFECEPYVYPQNILGDEHPQFGLGRNSWLSGTASWMYVAATKYILGIMPVYTGIRFDPCIPSSWKGFSVTRHCRGALYKIRVSNPTGISQGVKSIQVDGKMIAGTVVPFFTDEKTHEVEIIMGI